MPQRPTLLPIEQITREQFDRYRAVQRSGRLNMLDSRVESRARISRDVHVSIIHHYTELAAKWPAKEGKK